MNKYIALLRGINVGGHRKIPMADLRALFSNEGLSAVKTYIQSGNVVFNSSEKDSHILKQQLEKAILSTFGFGVPTVILTSDELNTILKNNPFEKQVVPDSYYIVPSRPIAKDRAVILNDHDWEQEHFSIKENCIYLYVENGYGKAKCTTNFFEKKLTITATARNHKTMLKLVSLSAEN